MTTMTVAMRAQISMLNTFSDDHSDCGDLKRYDTPVTSFNMKFKISEMFQNSLEYS